MRTKKCSECGSNNKRNAQFCSKCGYDLSGARIETRFRGDHLIIITLIIAILVCGSYGIYKAIEPPSVEKVYEIVSEYDSDSTIKYLDKVYPLNNKLFGARNKKSQKEVLEMKLKDIYEKMGRIFFDSFEN